MANKKIKICFVAPFAYGLFNPAADLKFGGAEVQMSLLARELALAENFEVDFIVLNIGQPSVETYDKVKLFKAYKQGRSWHNLIMAPIGLIKTLHRINPDIVVSRAAGAEVGLAAIYAKLFRKKFIYSLADDRDANGSKFGGLRGRLFKFGFEKADKIIAQSNFQLEDFKNRYPGRADKIEKIKNCWVVGVGEDAPEAAKENVLWVGSSAAVKRPEIFISLAKDFPQEKFVMIMTKSKEDPLFWERIKNEAEKLSNLEFIEQVPFGKIGGYFSKAKVLVNTSTHEGFANVFLQAAAAQTPILSLGVDNDKFIYNYNCGYACGDDYAIMKARLAELLASEESRQIMGENASQYLKKEHDIKINIEKWKNIFNELST